MWRHKWFFPVLLLVVVMMMWMTGPTSADSRLNKVIRLQRMVYDIEDTSDYRNRLVDIVEQRINEKCKEHTPPAPSRLDSQVRDDEGYYLAFRATAHIGGNVFDSYTAVGHNLDEHSQAMLRQSVPCGCKGVDGSVPCDRHYRSDLLDVWGRLPVEKVRVAAYIKGVEQLRIIFDGQGTDYLSFFRQGRVLESPYTDLASASPNYFSVEGDSGVQRRFFINNNYNGCASDAGWLAVVDGNGPGDGICLWERERNSSITDTYPKIFFSKDDVVTGWENGNASQADVLTVSIKLKDTQHCPSDYPGLLLEEIEDMYASGSHHDDDKR